MNRHSVLKLCLKKEREPYILLIIFRYITITLHTLDIYSIILSSREGNYVTGVIKTSPSNASIGAKLDTRENERFETFSTL